jgi:hypothetical protein
VAKSPEREFLLLLDGRRTLNPLAQVPQDNRRRTPVEIVALSRKVLGSIDLDPASDAEANLVIGATELYSEADDGLSRQWHGRVFLNPPGGRMSEEQKKAYGVKLKGPVSRTAVWWSRLVFEYEERGSISSAIFVCFNLEIFRTGQKFAKKAPFQYPFCIPGRRLVFPSSCGEKSDAPPGASAIVYLGHDLDLFRSVFSEIGACSS